MKGYESVTRTQLTRRTPAILRVDGRSFHTFVKRMGYSFPFDIGLSFTMERTAAALMHEIQGARLAYIQSDEISVLIVDYDKLETEAWFGGGVQKMCSVAAVVASNEFNKTSLRSRQMNVISEWAQFDARVFTLPKEEVCNYFIWRQQDATRNSVSMLASSEFSHKELHGVNVSGMQDMLMLQKGINWNDLDAWKKRGFCIRTGAGGIVLDREIPIFTQDREYVEDLVYLSREEADDKFAERVDVVAR